MMGINAVKGVEIGAGFASVAQTGTEHSDEMTPQGFLSNHAGGILGGISTGQDIVGRDRGQADFVDTSRSHGRSTRPATPVIVNTHGRHDPCVGIRATPIAEAMLALVLIDHALRHRAQNADVDLPDAEDRSGGAGRRSRQAQNRRRRSTIRTRTRPETPDQGVALRARARDPAAGVAAGEA